MINQKTSKKKTSLTDSIASGIKYKKSISIPCLSSLFIGIVCVSSANAADIQVLPYAVGDFEVSAQLDTSLGYSDNVFRGSTVEESATFFNIKPIVQAVNETSTRRITLDYEGEGAAFSESSEDNYISTKLGAGYVAKLSLASELGFGITYEDGNSVRGTDILEGSNGTVEGASEFENISFLTNYSYGGQKVGPTLELGFEYSDLEFKNFAVFNDGRDRTLTDFNARLGYQLSVSTQVFIDLGYSEFDYDGSISGFAGNLDNNQQKVEVGFKWRATKQTSGEISVGVTDKDFDDFSDPSSLTSWNAEVEWRATTRDVISLSTFSKPFEQNGTGLFVDAEEYKIQWDHKITPRWSVNTSWAKGRADFESVGRDDEYDRYQLGIAYQPTKFSALSLEFEYEDKESDDVIFDFEQSNVFLMYSTSL